MGCVPLRAAVARLARHATWSHTTSKPLEREFFIDNLLVRIHFIIVMIRWTGLAPWKFDFLFQVALHLPSQQVSVAMPARDLVLIHALLLESTPGAGTTQGPTGETDTPPGKREFIDYKASMITD